jgi:class 3 adenylate cyclase/tetratricopeptide (TPR) repeat protein
MSAPTTCPACGVTNPVEAKFCGSCGAALAASCPRCGHRNPAGGSFCLECGAALATAGLDVGLASPKAYTPEALAAKIRAGTPDLEGERKQITVLFADVAGFTSISEQLDPEETRAMMQRAFAVMLEEVHRYEGTVSQFLGDGMLALFGAPIAHEDHAQRAIRAGLGMQRGLADYRSELAARGIEFRIRVGLNSGPVVFGHVGTDLEFTFQAVGDTVNTASRVQGLARPGAVVVSESTYRLAEGYFAFEDLGAHEVKNKTEPIHVFEALRPAGPRSRVDVSAERGLSPFVGREAELQLLLDRFDDARAGRGQVVFVSGEAGLGKSRLVHELRTRLEPGDLLWLTGRCISYGADIPYVPIVDLTKSVCGIEETDPETAIDTKLTERVGKIGGDPSYLPYLRFLLSIDPGDPAVLEEDPMMRKPRVFEAFRDVLMAAVRQQPVVLVIEDLHWIDTPSAELISFVVDAVPKGRLLVLLTHRPEWVSPLGERPNYTRIELTALSERETALVAQGASGENALPDELAALIYRKAEGNPFFVEEVTKSLLEGGELVEVAAGYALGRPLDEILVPDTVQDVIMARLDRLAEEPRRALQTASVIGREFTPRLLERTTGAGATDDALRELKTVQLIFERSLYPELVFMFKHALTHEVAYGSLLLERRRALHGAVADAMRELYADRLAEVVETIAHHYERAERWGEAVAYLVRSAEKSLSGFALGEAQTYCDRALGGMERSDVAPDPTLLAHLHEMRGQCYELRNEWAEAITCYRAMVAAAEGAGDRATQGRGLAFISMAQIYAHELREGAETARVAEGIAAELGDVDLHALSLTAKLFDLVMGGELDESYPQIDALEAAARGADDPFTKILALDFAGEMRHFQADDVTALACIQEAAAMADVAQQAQPLFFVSFDLAITALALGRYDQAFAAARRNVELAERVGDQGFWWCRAKNTLGRIFIELCDRKQGARFNQEAVERALVFGDKETLRNAQLNLGDCALGDGEPGEALRIFEEVESDCAADTDPGEWMKWRYTQHLWMGLSATWLALGDTPKALTYADRCIALAEETRTRRYISKGRRGRAEALMALERLDEAAADATTSLAVAEEVGGPELAWRAHATLAAVFAAQGRAGEARAASAEGLAVVDAIAAKLNEPGAVDVQLSSRDVALLRAGAA